MKNVFSVFKLTGIGLVDNEEKYRRYFLAKDGDQFRLLLNIGTVIVLFLVIIDYLFFGFTREFFVLLAIRLGSIAINYVLRFHSLRIIRNNPARLDFLYWLWWMMMAALLVVVDLSRPPSYIQNQSLYILAMFNIYLMTPGRAYNKIIPATTISTAAILIIFFVKDQIPLPTDGIILAMMFVTHGLGLILASREEHHRRQQYMDQMRVEQAFRDMEKLARTDELTGLFNRRRLLETLESEFARFKRHEEPFCLLMLDFDHFKQINDQYGHLAGDEVLRQFASVIARVVRTIDVVGRVGGEEFAVICPETTVDQARVLAERIRLTSAEIRVLGEDSSIKVSASIGLSQVRKDDLNIDHLWLRADQALYAAKEGGRNRVEIVR
jgi:diguanylate cyclase (GGDEF)-like protein